MTKGLSLLLVAALLAQPAAPLFAASFEAPALPAWVVAAPVSFKVPAERGQFFAEIDLQLGGAARAFDAGSLTGLTAYLNASLPSNAALTPAQTAARQVLLGAIARPALRADAEGTMRFAAKGAKSAEEAAIAGRLADLTHRVEAADPRGTMAGRLESLSEKIFGGDASDARAVVGDHLDALFDGTPALAEGAPVYQKPGAAQDEFGRTNGWEDVPPEPADAPKAFRDMSIDVPAGGQARPSPQDWRDEVFYYVMIDRFGRVGETRPWGDPNDARTRHGGNIPGLISKLDYLRGLGVTAVVVSPIVMNTPAAYHGYSPIHRAAVEPALGTMADMKTLREELEKRGMHLIVDRVFNQTGPILKYKGGYKYSETPKEVEEIKYPLKPSEYVERVDEHFSRRGDINDWNSEEQKQHGDLPGGIPRLASENRSTQDLLLKETKWWVRESGEVGARVDALPHLAPGFLERLFPSVKEYAAKLGITNYLFLGELFEGDPRKYIPWLKEGRLDAAYNYISYYWNDEALHGRAPTAVLEGSFHKLGDILGPAVHRLVNFLGNHDRLHFLGPNDPVGVLHFALSYIFTSIGMPYLYGEEQAPRRVPGRKWLDIEAAREDRFPGGKFTNPASAEHSFDTQSPGYRLVSRLAALRQQYAALRRGEQYVRWSDHEGPGIFAFSRIHAGEEVLVVLNSSGESRSAEMWVDGGLTPAGTALFDAMDGTTEIKAYDVQGGSKVRVEVPAYGTRIFVRKAR